METIKKVLFLNPPDPTLVENENSHGYAYFEPPIGLLYVYSYLKNQNKYETHIVDLNIEMKFISKKKLEDTLEDLVNLYKPDLVAISALFFTSIDIFHRIAKKIKEINPDIKIVLGGYYPTHITNLALGDKNVDYAIISEGELGLSDLIEGLNSPAGIENVEGIAFKKDGKIIKNERNNFWKGFKDSKRLPWGDVHMEYYFKEGRIALSRIYKREELKLGAMTATRGCPNACTFCSSSRFFQCRWRYREVDSIVDEIKFLKDNYGVNFIIFNDVNISLSKEWFLKLLDELKKLNVKWLASGGLSIRTINDEEIIKKMYESNVAMFNVAIESGNAEIMKRIKKPLTLGEVENVVKLIRKYGDAYIIGSFIVGFPFETKKQVIDTLEFAGKLQLDWSALYCLHPLPGTEVYDYCIDNNLITEYDAQDSRDLEFHSAVEIKYPDYTKEELNKLNYLYNIKYNFLKNRNLLLGTEDRLAQAERDFNSVLDVAPNHFFVYFCLAEIEKKRGNSDKRSEYLKKAKEILENDKSFDWSYYVREIGVDVNKSFLDIKEIN